MNTPTKLEPWKQDFINRFWTRDSSNNFYELKSTSDVWKMIQFMENEIEKAVEAVRERANIVWVCHTCATQLFGRKFTDKTNIYTQVTRNCECCNEELPCMHIRSYDR